MPSSIVHEWLEEGGFGKVRPRAFSEYDPLSVSPKQNPCPQMLGSPKGTDIQTPNLTISCVEQLQRLWGKTHDMPLLHSLDYLEILNSLDKASRASCVCFLKEC